MARPTGIREGYLRVILLTALVVVPVLAVVGVVVGRLLDSRLAGLVASVLLLMPLNVWYSRWDERTEAERERLAKG